MKYKAIFITGMLFFTCLESIIAQITNDSYRVETIKMPDGLTSETGAVEFLPDGRLVASFTRGGGTGVELSVAPTGTETGTNSPSIIFIAINGSICSSTARS